MFSTLLLIVVIDVIVDVLSSSGSVPSVVVSALCLHRCMSFVNVHIDLYTIIIMVKSYELTLYRDTPVSWPLLTRQPTPCFVLFRRRYTSTDGGMPFYTIRIYIIYIGIIYFHIPIDRPNDVLLPGLCRVFVLKCLLENCPVCVNLFAVVFVRRVNRQQIFVHRLNKISTRVKYQISSVSACICLSLSFSISHRPICPENGAWKICFY